ncbi:MAG: septum formation initiator family protein [Candidatus Nomurabacteria bacterium]|jgi:cell division protein FtsB|nr:septum formation initiator family protein [Candidatus Nomurabacteria bacterium]
MLNDSKKYLTFNNILLLAATVLALYWAWSTIGALNRNYELEQQLGQAQLETEVLELQNENLKLEQSYYQTDEYLELQSRSLLNKSKEGEHLVILPKTETAKESETAKTSSDDESNFEKWMDFLFGAKS